MFFDVGIYFLGEVAFYATFLIFISLIFNEIMLCNEYTQVKHG